MQIQEIFFSVFGKAILVISAYFLVSEKNTIVKPKTLERLISGYLLNTY